MNHLHFAWDMHIQCPENLFDWNWLSSSEAYLSRYCKEKEKLWPYNPILSEKTLFQFAYIVVIIPSTRSTEFYLFLTSFPVHWSVFT